MGDPVAPTTAPNVPKAEVLCGKLKEAGIPSSTRTRESSARRGGGSGVNRTVPVEIYVNFDDLERAEQLLA
jgi:Putative prokaryotic signal transducing protein